MSTHARLAWILFWSFSVAFATISEAAPLRVGIFNSACKPDDLPFLVAREKKYFSDENIQVRESFYRRKEGKALDDADQNAAKYDVLIAGRARYYYMEATKPGRFKAFTGNVNDQEHPDYAIVVRSDSQIQSLADLRGKKIGLEEQAGRAKFVLMDLVLEKNSLDPKDFQIQAASTPDILSGKVDALYLRQPELSLALDSGKLRVLVDAPVVKFVMSPWPMGFAAFSSRFAEKKPEMARKIVAIWDKAVDFIRSNPDEAKLISNRCMKANYGKEPQHDIRQIRYWKTAEMNVEVIQKQVDLYFSKKLIPKSFKAEDLILNLPAQRLLSSY